MSRDALRLTIHERGATRVQRFADGIVKIGKLETCHLRFLDDDEVSRLHAVIEIDRVKKRFHLVDLGSAFGTFVNGDRITSCALQERDTIRVGDVRIVVEIEPVAPTRPAPPRVSTATHPAPDAEAAPLIHALPWFTKDQGYPLRSADTVSWGEGDGEESVAVSFIKHAFAADPWPRLVLTVRTVLGHQRLIFDPPPQTTASDLVVREEFMLVVLDRLEEANVPVDYGWGRSEVVSLETCGPPQARGGEGLYRGRSTTVTAQDSATLVERAREWLRSGPEQRWSDRLDADPRFVVAMEAALTHEHLYVRRREGKWERVALNHYRGAVWVHEALEVFAFGRRCLVRFADPKGAVPTRLRALVMG